MRLGFVVFDSFAALDLLGELREFVRMFGRDENCDWFTDSLRRAVAIDAFRARIPACDYAVEAFADDGIFRKFDDGTEFGADLFSLIF